MTHFALVIAASIALGFALAEILHRFSVRRYSRIRQREALVAEFLDKQIWRFLSLDDWLKGNKP